MARLLTTPFCNYLASRKANYGSFALHQSINDYKKTKRIKRSFGRFRLVEMFGVSAIMDFKIPWFPEFGVEVVDKATE